MTTSGRNTHYPALDGTRGIAITLVLLLHYVAQAMVVTPGSASGYFHKLLSPGWIGVDLFFALSGFLVSSILLRHRAAGNLRRVFFLRRAARILPLYALLLLGVYLFQPLIQQQSGTNTTNNLPDPASWPWFLSFTQNLAAGFAADPWNYLGRLLGPTWSICIEEHFYLFAGLLLPLVAVRHIVPLVLTLLAMMAIARGLGMMISDAPKTTYYIWTWFHADAILIGIVVAALHVQDRLPKMLAHRTIFPLWVIGLALVWLWLIFDRDLLVNRVLNFTLVAVLAGTLIAHLLQTPTGSLGQALKWPPLRWLGTRSYFIYLMHLPILIAVDTLTKGWGINNEIAMTRVAVALCLVLLLAEISWRFLEQPILGRARLMTYLYPLRTSATTSAIRT